MYLFLKVSGCQLIPPQAHHVTKRDKWVTILSKVETEPSKFNYKKVKQQNKKGESDGGNQGSHLAPGKTVQSQRLVVMGERLTEGASGLPQWPRGAFVLPHLAWALAQNAFDYTN